MEAGFAQTGYLVDKMGGPLVISFPRNNNRISGNGK